MTLYYVPVLLVIEADSVDRASTMGHHIIDTVADLEPDSLVGWTISVNMPTQPVVRAWFDCDQVITMSGDQALVEEVPS